MIPRKLTISGFLSYQDPVEIDFEKFHTACISGQNGAGKSSILDAITWALFNEARRNDESIINDRYPSQRAEVIFEFEYEKAYYKIKRTKEISKTSTVEFFIADPADPEKWRSLTEKRVTDTNQKICETLRMNYDTFINASFFVQGEADLFTSKTPAERKQVLSNILDLDIWEIYLDRAVRKRKESAAEMALTESRLQDVENELSEENQRVENLSLLEEKLKKAEEERELLFKSYQNARTAQAQIEYQRAAAAELQNQVLQQENKIQLEEKREKSRLAEAENLKKILQDEDQIKLHMQLYKEADEKLKDFTRKSEQYYALDNQRLALSSQIENEQIRITEEIHSLSHEKQSLDEKTASLEKLENDQCTFQKEIDEIKPQIALKEETSSKIEQITRYENEKKVANAQLKQAMQEIQKKMGDVSHAEGTPCPFCGRLMDEAHCQIYLEQLESSGKELGDQYRKNKHDLEETTSQKELLQKQSQNIQNLESRLLLLSQKIAPCSAQINMIHKEIEKWEKQGKSRLEALESTRSSADFQAEKKNQLLEISDRIKTLNYDAAEHHNWRKKAEQYAGADQKFQELQKAKAALEPLEREIQELDRNIADQKLALSGLNEKFLSAKKKEDSMSVDLPNLEEAKNAFEAAQMKENSIRQEKGAAEQLVNVLQSLKEKRTSLLAERKKTELRIGQLKSLEKAFGKDGVPALLIEQALPEIEEQANIILGQLSDDKMSLKFNTQRDYKDKSRTAKKETLDIMISDPFGTREYELFSGGEAFRINFAIRLALSRLLANRAGSRLQMLAIDEGFGSQDAEGREHLIEAIASVQDDFEKILVITHFDEIREAFPSRIEVEKTDRGTSVNVIP